MYLTKPLTTGVKCVQCEDEIRWSTIGARIWSGSGFGPFLTRVPLVVQSKYTFKSLRDCRRDMLRMSRHGWPCSAWLDSRPEKAPENGIAGLSCHCHPGAQVTQGRERQDGTAHL